MFTLSLLLTHCLASPLGPLVNLLQDDMMGEMMEAGAMAGGAMDMADMTAMGEIKININSRLEDEHSTSYTLLN